MRQSQQQTTICDFVSFSAAVIYRRPRNLSNLSSGDSGWVLLYTAAASFGFIALELNHSTSICMYKN